MELTSLLVVSCASGLVCDVYREAVGSVGQETAEQVEASKHTDVRAISRSSSRSSGTRSPSPVHDKDRRRRSRSHSRSSRSRSRSQSSRSSRSRSRSRSDDRRSRSRSPEVKRDKGDGMETKSGVVESELPTEAVAVQPAEQQHSSSDEDDSRAEPMQTTTKEV